VTSAPGGFCQDDIETYIRRAASAIGAGVPEEEVEARFREEGCPEESARLYAIAGRQLVESQGIGFQEIEKGISFAGEGGEECHVCQPFTQLVKDKEKFKICMLRAEKIGELKNPKSFYELFRDDLERQDQEVFVVACVDFRGKLRAYSEISRGQRHRVATDVEDVQRIVLASGCDGFAVAHNHPSGIAEPSEADGDLTNAIKEAISKSAPSIHFLDHCVVGSGQWYSFAMNDWRDNGEVIKA